METYLESMEIWCDEPWAGKCIAWARKRQKIKREKSKIRTTEMLCNPCERAWLSTFIIVILTVCSKRNTQHININCRLCVRIESRFDGLLYVCVKPVYLLLCLSLTASACACVFGCAWMFIHVFQIVMNYWPSFIVWAHWDIYTNCRCLLSTSERREGERARRTLTK